MTHLNALEYRLHNETMRLNAATDPAEIKLRKVWAAGVQKEVDRERAFLGLPAEELDDMSIEEIFAELDL